MTRTFAHGAAVLAALLVTTATASADGTSQLAAIAGLSPVEAEGMTLTEIYAVKVNREARRDDRITVSSRQFDGLVSEDHAGLVAAAGLSMGEAYGMSLSELAAHKNNLRARQGDEIPIVVERSAFFDPADHPQLLARAGLTAEEAEGMTLAEVHAAKVYREARFDDR
jgi:hypothetical protein